ncbi:hypothetical protein [Streptomyces sp. CAU 1734]|uniref:hypothetical protein n=1 Tax=Streptomyces sp. CAU 1734 TaxID=3140360 RepID=UPI0032614D70
MNNGPSPHAAARDLVAAMRRQTVAVGQQTPGVAGATSRLATVAAVTGDGNITTTDGIIARRLRGYTNPAIGDLIRIDGSPAGGWTTPGPLAQPATDGAWTPYTPSWTAATTNPAIGNAARTGRYRLEERTCHISILIIPGNTTTFGAGTYLFGVPFPAAADTVEYLGTARLTAGSTYIGQTVLQPGATVLNATFPATATPATAANMAPTAPATFASGHSLRLSLTYQTA